MRICNTGVLLVISRNFVCDLICVCSDDLHELNTHMNFMIYGIHHALYHA